MAVRAAELTFALFLTVFEISFNENPLMNGLSCFSYTTAVVLSPKNCTLTLNGENDIISTICNEKTNTMHISNKRVKYQILKLTFEGQTANPFSLVHVRSLTKYTS